MPQKKEQQYTVITNLNYNGVPYAPGGVVSLPWGIAKGLIDGGVVSIKRVTKMTQPAAETTDTTETDPK